MSNGVFCWYELMTSDLAAAQAFYGSVVGWTATDSGMPGIMDYTIFSVPEGHVAGAMIIPETAAAQGVPPNWTGYVRVEDVDARLPRLEAAGGSVLRPAEDIPGVGRFAVVADPGGAVFCLFREREGTSPPLPVGSLAPGRIGWHELHAADGDAAFAFYSSLFGWQESGRHDMGPMGIYRLFASGPEGAIGGMMTKTAECPMPYWLYYFGVEALDAALERVRAGGGRVVLEPMQVPGGGFIAQCLDPQGAMFALLAPKR